MGVFTSANQLNEVVVMTVENLTGRLAQLVREAFSYTEQRQEDLELGFSPLPLATRLNPEGRRGTLE
jgi:hypothetical protein